MKFPCTLLIVLMFCLHGCIKKQKKVKLQEIWTNQSPEEKAFISFWKEFSIKFNSRDTVAMWQIVLDSIWLWGDEVSSNEFIKRYYKGYSSADFLGILDTNKIMYSPIGCVPSPIPEGAIRVQPGYGYGFVCRKATISQDTVGSVVQGIQFTFLETLTGYRLSELNYSSYYWRPPEYNGVDTTLINQ